MKAISMTKKMGKKSPSRENVGYSLGDTKVLTTVSHNSNTVQIFTPRKKPERIRVSALCFISLSDIIIFGSYQTDDVFPRPSDWHIRFSLPYLIYDQVLLLLPFSSVGR